MQIAIGENDKEYQGVGQKNNIILR